MIDATTTTTGGGSEDDEDQQTHRRVAQACEVVPHGDVLATTMERLLAQLTASDAEKVIAICAPEDFGGVQI